MTAWMHIIPRSFPKPDILNPPNGAATSVLLYVFTNTVPASSFSLQGGRENGRRREGEGKDEGQMREGEGREGGRRESTVCLL